MTGSRNKPGERARLSNALKSSSKKTMAAPMGQKTQTFLGAMLEEARRAQCPPCVRTWQHFLGVQDGPGKEG